MAKLYYHGHGSFRLISDSGMVIYVDPNIGNGYEPLADLILITHAHEDHNNLNIVPKKKNCIIITQKEALVEGDYKIFEIGEVVVQAVQAYNKNHPINSCVGYLLTIDGVLLYAAGDTSETDDMHNKLGLMNIDYALYPTDGIYNMDAKEASVCAEIVGAKHSIPIHSNPEKLYDKNVVEKFTAPGAMFIEPGEEIVL